MKKIVCIFMTCIVTNVFAMQTNKSKKSDKKEQQQSPKNIKKSYVELYFNNMTGYVGPSSKYFLTLSSCDKKDLSIKVDPEMVDVQNRECYCDQMVDVQNGECYYHQKAIKKSRMTLMAYMVQAKKTKKLQERYKNNREKVVVNDWYTAEPRVVKNNKDIPDVFGHYYPAVEQRIDIRDRWRLREAVDVEPGTYPGVYRPEVLLISLNDKNSLNFDAFLEQVAKNKPAWAKE